MLALIDVLPVLIRRDNGAKQDHFWQQTKRDQAERGERERRCTEFVGQIRCNKGTCYPQGSQQHCGFRDAPTIEDEPAPKIDNDMPIDRIVKRRERGSCAACERWMPLTP